MIYLAAAAATAFSPPLTKAQDTKPPIKIGVLTDMSGAYADLSGPRSLESVKMAVEDLREELGGRKVEILTGDHQNKPDIGSAIARRWLDVDGVDAIVNVTTTPVALAVQRLVKEKRGIVLFTGPGNDALTGEECSPYGVHWVYNAYSQTVATARAVMADGGESWYFFTADYLYGHSLEAAVSKVVTSNGGRVLGSARHPIGTADFSSLLLRAQSSKAKVIGLAGAGADVQNAMKQGEEFGLQAGGQSFVGLTAFITDIHSIGLKTARGTYLTTAFYWDRDDLSREWSKRFFARTGRMPTMIQAGDYSATAHYLQAVIAENSTDRDRVMARMRATPVDDFFARKAHIREDGMMAHDMYLVQVKSPEESKAPWDYYNIRRVIPATEAFVPLAQSTCPLVRAGAAKQ
jgi:branched-chain amino acid transport system substrate-binding protein